MVSSEMVAEAVKAIWNNETALSDPDAGSVRALVMGRLPVNQTAPYTTVKVTGGEIAARTATGGYLQKFTVEFKTWGEAGGGGAAIGPIKEAIETAFEIRRRTVVNIADSRTVAILHSLKVPGAIEEDAATKQGQAVQLATNRFEWLCQS